MRNLLKKFARDETGVVSVDWIVMCGSVLCIGCLAVATASDGTFGLADSIKATVEDTHVGGAND